jgi:[ribosomal protein S18]-alanine N-acetyltransferase
MMLRRATARDLSAMSALHAASFPDAWSGVSLGELLASPGAFAFIAIEVSSLAAGFVLARVAAGEAEVLTIAVRPNARHKGLGRVLMEAAAAHAREMGARTMFLEVGETNAAARRLYRTLGFAEVARRKGYYDTENGLVLKAELPLSAPALGK